MPDKVGAGFRKCRAEARASEMKNVFPYCDECQVRDYCPHGDY